MEESNKYLLEGRKTFFICPDVSMFPDTYMEDYLKRGYETYIINDDRTCTIKEKVQVIIDTFKDSILFFYIDTSIEDVNWKEYIKSLQDTYKDTVLIGVLYAKRTKPEEMHALERYYLYDVGIKCGCIALEYQKDKNFTLIDKVMFANQACGRRKNVRAVCDIASTVIFNHDKKKWLGKISDVSLSHFSCVFDLEPKIPLYEKIEDILVDVGGMHFHTDGIFLECRQLQDRNLYIFIFAQQNGKQGLDEDIKTRLSEKIYNMVTEKVKNLLRDLFQEEHKRNSINSRNSAFPF
ncbi:MAG: hypothetical protein K6E22_15065 [Treponema sp.]|nr:hypothetical protein [Treponema sp.]